VRDCLAGYETELTRETCLSVWREWVAETIAPDAEFVAIRERTGHNYHSWKSVFWKFIEEGRAPGWSAGEDRWLDREGTLFGRRVDGRHKLYGGSSVVVLLAGASLRPRRVQGRWLSDGHTVDERRERGGDLRAAMLACVDRATEAVDHAT
jgi:hypothetical protein